MSQPAEPRTTPDPTILQPRDVEKFLQTVERALLYDLDEEDALEDELEDYRGAIADVQAGELTPRLLKAAWQFAVHVDADWIQPDGFTFVRWQRVFNAYGMGDVFEARARITR